MGQGYGKTTSSNLELLKKRIGDSSLLVVDEISMMGCKKLLRLDYQLQKLKNNNSPFGGLDVIVIGDYAQLPPVRQEPVMDTMVHSTKMYTEHSELTLNIEALFGQFRKFELSTLMRSKGSKKLKRLLKKFRNFDTLKPPLNNKDLRKIGVFTEQTQQNDPKFRNAPILVSTRKERDLINLHAGKR